MRNIGQNMSFRVVVAQFPKVMEVGKKDGKIIFTGNGYLAKLFFIVQEYLGFSYELILENQYGVRLPDGNWTGRAGYLYRNEADISVPHIMSYAHYKIIDYVDANYLANIIFSARKGRKTSQLYAIIQPFLLEVWIGTLISFLMGICFFYLIFNLKAKHAYAKKVPLSVIISELFGSFTNQGANLFNPVRLSCRLLSIGWILSIFVLSASYSGALMSFITFPTKEFVPRTYSELFASMEHGHFRASTLLQTAIGKYIMDQETKQAIILKDFLDKGYLTNFHPDHLKRRNLAIINFDEYLFLQVKIVGERDFLYSTDSFFNIFGFAALRKAFPFKKQFSKIVRRCFEMGLREKFILDEVIRHTKEKLIITDTSEYFHPLILEDLFGAFGVLIIGYIISILVFISEMLSKII